MTGALAASVSLLAGGIGCGSFGAADAPTTDGGPGVGDVVLEPPQPRDVRVEAGWPTLAGLDPAKDLRLSKILVVVTDATDSSRRVEKSFASTELGPYEFTQFNTSNVVDVTIELSEGSGRLLGYGERRGWNLSTSKTVPVAARKRLLYFTSADRDDGQLRTLDLAPAGEAEPRMKELDPPDFPSLSEPRALYVTTDGRLLVQAGQARGGTAGAGQLTVFDTGTHALSKTITLKYRLSAAIPLGDGHRLLGAPARDAKAATFAITDIDSMMTTELATGLQGGAITIESITTSPDGARVAAVGSYADGNSDVPYAFTYDVGASTVSKRDLTGLVDVARGVRFMPDGKTLVVAGAKDDGDWATGALLFFDATAGALADPKRTIPLAKGLTRVSSLMIDPAGKYAYVGNETNYGAQPACCADLRIIDLESGAQVAVAAFGSSGPEFELLEGVRLPYGARRVVVGQSDPGNNVHGPFVELVPSSPTPVPIGHVSNGDIGSINGLATPFGTRL